jgi:hypothetical protein
MIIAPLLGCSGAQQIDSAHFGPSTAIERAIARHYERYASEGDCFQPYIDGFTRLTVLEDMPQRLVVDVRYLYRDRFHDGGQGHGARGHGYSGFGARTFTLGRGSEGALVVVAMTGEQPAIRSSARRVLSS